MTIKFTWPLQHPSDGGTGGAAGTDGKGAEGKTGEQPVIAGDSGAGAGGDGKTKTGDAGAGDGKGGDKGQGKGTEGAAGTEGKGKAGEGDTKPKAPAKYELKLPDGGRLDEGDLKTVEELARASDMTNEEAQGFLDEQAAVITAQSERYLTTTKADKDYGGEQLETTQKLARQVIDRIRPVGHARRESFIKFINRGGAGNHIDVVSFLADIGKLMAEDSTVGGFGSGGKGKDRDATEVLYDNKG